ncbi:hypothetical protein [Winogradskyella jejuensis]|uniref:Uncharacterized protein n=1 Tax=Winogradskyella jejuensis TaxID=1089305 RepID=A0A1M5KGL3_9FLAO|nr:hypothetical protein [Winogradskyella jejuensis]SHG51835.1 hypothetical protein SAMN05444148_0325 [Winogradskyella jejuensis]
MKTDIKSTFNLNRLKHYSLVLFLFLGVYANAQDPNWVVDENEFEFTMTFVSTLNLDGTELSSTNDQLAAFVGSELRGVANLTYVASADRYYAYLTAFANTNGEILSFKIYDSVNDTVRDVSTTVVFETNGHQGNIFQAVSFADPVLNNETDILTYSFSGVTAVNTLIDATSNEIVINVDQSQDITSLTPVFTLSSGASLYIGTVEQTSNIDSVDFTNPVTYSVLSEDNSILEDWTVTVNKVNTDLQYFKKDAVCYEDGAIKVVTTENFTVPVRLFFNSTEIASQSFINGEVLFPNLDANTYEVRIGNIIKNIEVELRTN